MTSTTFVGPVLIVGGSQDDSAMEWQTTASQHFEFLLNNGAMANARLSADHVNRNSKCAIFAVGYIYAGHSPSEGFQTLQSTRMSSQAQGATSTRRTNLRATIRRSRIETIKSDEQYTVS